MNICLIIHGFSGGPYEVEPLCGKLKIEGYSVVSPTLAGHNASRKEMKKTTYKDWIYCAEKEFLELSKNHGKIHLIGFSMGGLISIYLASKYPDRVKSLTLLAAAVFTVNTKQWTKTLFEAIHKSFQNSKLDESIERYLKKLKYTPLKATIEFKKIQKMCVPRIQELNVPLLIIQGNADEIVFPHSAKHIYIHSKTSDKSLITFENSKHQICRGEDFSSVSDSVLTFLKSKEF